MVCITEVTKLKSPNDMLQVTRKDKKESLENMIRRFNRKVQQSGVLSRARANMTFEKPTSKRDRRLKAIVRNERRAEKARKASLGLR
jgi:ribosomal protein S21